MHMGCHNILQSMAHTATSPSVCVCVVVLSALSVLRVCKSVRLKAHAVVTHSFRLYWWVSSVFVLTETLTLHIVVRATMAGGDYTLDN